MREHTVGGKKAKRKAGHAKAPHAVGSRADEGRRTMSTPTRSAPRLTSMVPVRFEPAMLEEIRARAETDGRSVSSWIRRAVERELRRDTDA